ncbi:MAG: hypothetical protein WBO50_05555, partial [Nitrospira sp.]
RTDGRHAEQRWQWFFSARNISAFLNIYSITGSRTSDERVREVSYPQPHRYLNEDFASIR